MFEGERQSLEKLSRSVREKQARLAELRATIADDRLANLERAHHIDITFTSNALEGNTLTAGETALVLEKGLTIGGRPLKDHLEATDHAKALNWVIEIADLRRSEPIKENDVRALHHLIMAQTGVDIAGQYADRARFVNSSRGVHAFPAPWEIPSLMRSFVDWLRAAPSQPESAFEAHRRLVSIHPFNDGNGRTARLLMNLMLLRAGYPAIAIRPEDRASYISALETIDSPLGINDFDRIMLHRLDQTLDLYLDAIAQAQPGSS